MEKKMVLLFLPCHFALSVCVCEMIWSTNHEGHFGPLQELKNDVVDPPWDEKLSALIWRGRTSGKHQFRRFYLMNRWGGVDSPVLNLGFSRWGMECVSCLY